MTTGIGNPFLRLLKRNETLWPHPEGSTGIFYRQMGRNGCWEAVGPAREVFIQIAEEIKLHLEKSSDPVSHTVTWTIYMIGRTRERAKPTIMFCCQVPGPRKRVRKLINESDILGKYPGIVTGDSTRPPDFDQLVQLAGSEEMGYPYPSMAEMEKCILYEPSMGVCGVPIYITDDNVPGALLRKATIGGVLRAGLKYYCLTVAHAFTDNIQVPSLNSEIVPEFEFDVDGQSDSDEDDMDMVDTTSRGSESPESAESPSSQLSASDLSAQTQELPRHPSSVDFDHEESTTGGVGDLFSGKVELNAARGGIPKNLRDIRAFSILSSLNGPHPGLDYALIETDQPEFHNFNQINSTGSSRQYLLHPERVVSTRPNPKTKVLAATAFSGVLEGTISGTPTFMRIPSSITFQEVWTVRLFGKLTNGDCGSWVVNLESGDLYGHIITGCPESGVAYVVPACQIYEGLRSLSGLDLRLSVREFRRDHWSRSTMLAENLCGKESEHNMSTLDQDSEIRTTSLTQLQLGSKDRKSSSGASSVGSYRSLSSCDVRVFASSAATSQPASFLLDCESMPGQPGRSYLLPETAALSRQSGVKLPTMDCRSLSCSMESRPSTSTYIDQTMSDSSLLPRGSQKRNGYSTTILEEPGAGLYFYETSSEEQSQDKFLAPPMDRNRSPGSSMDSNRSIGSSLDRNYAPSSLSSCCSLPPDGGLARSGSQYESPQNSYMLPETLAPSPERSTGLPFLFNIEKDGDPRIEWMMYYDFIVTKTEAYFQLRPGYLATEKYPSCVTSEKVVVNGEKRHPCCMLGCNAKPFTRHYDLERHFKTIHQNVTIVEFNCDYIKCPHKEPFRKDHCREHYREFHAEDLIKRNPFRQSKSKFRQRKPETVEEFLASRLDNLNLTWWRCTKCLQRVKLNDHGYTCPACKMACEPERVVCRENDRKLRNNERAADSTSDYSSVPSSYVTACGQCENTWVPDETDPTLWHSCPRCRPSVEETMHY